jgi:hypothetical protein
MTSTDDGKEHLVCTAELVGPNSKSVHFAWITMRGRLRCLNWRSINGHHAKHPEVLGEPVLRPNCHVHVENNMVKAIAANKPRRRFSLPRESEEGSSAYSSIFIRFLAYRESDRIWALKTPTVGCRRAT